MIGAIAGDEIGSVHEGSDPQSNGFLLFSPWSQFADDTVLTVAVASAIRQNLDYASSFRHWGHKYPNAGYGGLFQEWLFADDPRPYNSYGNGFLCPYGPWDLFCYSSDDLDLETLLGLGLPKKVPF